MPCSASIWLEAIAAPERICSSNGQEEELSGQGGRLLAYAFRGRPASVGDSKWLFARRLLGRGRFTDAVEDGWAMRVETESPPRVLAPLIPGCLALVSAMPEYLEEEGAGNGVSWLGRV